MLALRLVMLALRLVMLALRLVMQPVAGCSLFSYRGGLGGALKAGRVLLWFCTVLGLSTVAGSWLRLEYRVTSGTLLLSLQLASALRPLAP